MRTALRILCFWLTAPLLAACLWAAEPAEPAPAKPSGTDVIIFSNGDQLTGSFLRAVGDSVTFHSDVVGDVTVPWSKVRELRSSKEFAVVAKQAKVNRRAPMQSVPHGAITVAEDKIRVHSDAEPQPEPIPIKSAMEVLDTSIFAREFGRRPGLFNAWKGSLTAGGTLVQATQETRIFNGAISLVRAIPTVPYLQARNKTSFGFSGSYGTVTQSGVTSAKTSIFHAAAERDQYFSTRFYVLAQTAFDHNYSQSLDLQQIYGGGLGWTIRSSAHHQLDVKATLQYENQQFANASAGTNQDLIGSTYTAAYRARLPHSWTLNQQVSYIPAYNNTRAYSVTETNSLVVPFYKRLSLSIGTLDTYLNDPAVTDPPTKRNSFQFTTGITYTLK